MLIDWSYFLDMMRADERKCWFPKKFVIWEHEMEGKTMEDNQRPEPQIAVQKHSIGKQFFRL